MLLQIQRSRVCTLFNHHSPWYYAVLSAAHHTASLQLDVITVRLQALHAAQRVPPIEVLYDLRLRIKVALWREAVAFGLGNLCHSAVVGG